MRADAIFESQVPVSHFDVHLQQTSWRKAQLKAPSFDTETFLGSSLVDNCSSVPASIERLTYSRPISVVQTSSVTNIHLPQLASGNSS